MNYTDLLAWLSGGGYGYLPSWPTNQCIAYNAVEQLLVFAGSNASPYTPSSADQAATSWEHSPSHGDKPPRQA